MPLFRRRGELFGTLCALDPEPSEIDSEELEILEQLASLIAFNLEIEESERDRQLLIGTLGHDLRNPLQALTLQNGIARLDPGLSPQTLRALESSEAAIARMSRLTSDLLNFARLRFGGGFQLQSARLDLHQVSAQAVVEVVRPEDRERVQLQSDGDVTMVGDQDRLFQALQNLIANAVEHSTSSTPIEIMVNGRKVQKIELSIKNQGTPIPPAAQAELFSPFHGSSGSSGSGLGLYIVHEIAKAHSGSVSCQSSLQGTTFTLTLPRSEEAPVLRAVF